MEDKKVKNCSRCETLPVKIEGEGKLYIWFPLGHSSNKTVSFFRRNSKRDYESLGERQCSLLVHDNEELESIARELSSILSSEELKGSQSLFMLGGAEPQFADFSRVTSLHQFLSVVQSNWLIDMLAEERVTSYFQPIVSAEDSSQIFAHEALMRGTDENGGIISPGEIFGASRNADLLFQVDLMARRCAIREASRHGYHGRLFINFNPTAIYDPLFCLRSTVKAVADAGFAPENIVFEVTESDRTVDIDHLIGILKFYRQAGFLVALDDLGAGYSSLNLIHQLRPDFIKLDMELTRDVHKDAYKALIAEKLLEIAHQLGIKTIAEGIEQPEELDWVREHGADFVQGYLIARPAPSPISSLPMIDKTASTNLLHQFIGAATQVGHRID